MNLFYVCKLTALFLILTSSSTCFSDNVQKIPTKVTIRFVSEYWEGFVNTDGSGLIKELLTTIYRHEGYHVVIHVMPMKRTALAITQDKANAVVGTFAAEKMNKLELGVSFTTPSHPIGVSQIIALCNAPHEFSLQAPPNKHNLRYAWGRGYFYDQLLKIPKDRTVKNTEQGFRMLISKRLDCFLDSKEDLLFTAQAAGVSLAEFRITAISRQPLYLAFPRNTINEKLVAIFDHKMNTLIDNGAIFSLYESFGQDYKEITGSNKIE